MSNLRPPGLDPIVGHTTDTTARIWIRSPEVDNGIEDTSSNRRTIGVMAVTREGGRVPSRKRVQHFRPRREFDRTGVFTLGEDTGIGEPEVSLLLQPDTEYEVCAGTLIIEDPNPEDDSIPSSELARYLPDVRQWWDHLLDLPPEKSRANFRTFP